MDLAVGASEATIKSLLTKLGTLLAEEYTLIRGVRGDIQFIKDELASMQAFLSNLSHTKDGHDDQTEDWMKQIREVAYDIEDCVDDFTHSLDPDRRGGDLWSIIVRALYELRTWWPRRNIAAKIAELKERAQHVGERRNRYGVPNPDPSKKKSSLGGYFAAEHQEITPRLVGINEPVGVNDMKKLQDWIVSDEKELGVLSIFGFGGVGKTTAALALYRNCGVKFKRRAMVTVSHGTDPDEVLKDILEQVKESNVHQQGQIHSTASSSVKKNQASPDPQSMMSFFQKHMSRLSRITVCACSQVEDGRASKEHKAITRELQEQLQGNRYLLLIDDVWSSSTWQKIWSCLPKNVEGSRVMVTTRFEAVAKTSLPDHNYFHKMQVLSQHDAKGLFEKSMEGRQPGQKDRVPARIWEMCGGLPLPIVTMAGLVASMPRTEHKEWIEVCESLFPRPQICHKPEEFMRIINFCYTALPSDLKTCSLYLCLFPKGRNIRRKRLIRRWIAEGFVSEKQGLSVEDVAETCFNQLIDRKIIRPIKHSSNGKVKRCQVHDMVHEYIISKAGEENFATVVGGQWSMPTRSNKVRRLSLQTTDSEHAKEAYRMNLSHVRSLTVFGSLDHLHLKSFKAGIVQVLDLEGCGGFNENRVSVSDICKMTLLKYLSLRGTDVRKLPSNIGDLKYLETLDVRETKVCQLPPSVGQLERISNILGGDKETRAVLKVPREIKGTAKTLHVLSGIEIAEGSNTASELNDFTRLRKLAIYKLRTSDSLVSKKKSEQMLKDLISSIQYLSGYYLKTLVIDVESSDFLILLDAMESPPIYLTALELSGRLVKLPKWLPDLSNLVKLALSATTLHTDTLKLLSNLRTLFSLTFSVCAAKHDPDIAAILEMNKSNNRGEIFVPAGGFLKLKLLRIFIPLLPSLNFSKGAMPAVERLELRFKRLEGLHGMDNLESIHDVMLTVDGQSGGTTKLILDELKRTQRKYALNVNE
ncbi:Disease resistance protein RPM1 [Dichanthelium oligosanthes]|uniref:Disease resistance protein RPM1 n=1 Tax=Dichanthelium oligosanthes TaxID=888268 RepID=A0A1E5US06_9POAL|nr:Disease resistance protein RPM1 [Dichanthelium oligosanthes]